ncbi:hypothetical protein LUZ63_018042 [Rhynchospora breviuscula]|uniref:Uncharacterized protein n=1 Tax=Rhynchospora breviuscula TaxID=2022672 RepID=A0A9Q0HGW5_9POAL|nr:hypothetical protein LUZ63_018042 [Rhynchospora breviuscula]
MDAPQSPCLKHEGKFYARLLTKESSMSNPSFRYYGLVPGSVPFLWEAEPGTPKVVVSGITVPPITPPPSYQYRYSETSTRKKKNKRFIMRINVIAAVFRRFRLKKVKTGDSTSVSSSSRWLFTMPAGEGGSARYNSSPRHRFMCFSMRRAPRFLFLCYHS